MTLAERLRALRSRNLTTSDLAYWLDRPWSTVRTWEQGRKPHVEWMEEIFARLEVLEKLPSPMIVPFAFTQPERAAFLERLKHVGRTTISRINSSE